MTPNKYFITGATGLIGVALAKHLANSGEDVVAYVRNKEKADSIFADYKNITVIEGDLMSPIEYDQDISYIIHAAAPTDSKFFIEKPVETIDAIVFGTKMVLEFARTKKIKSVLNLSSMEIYGTPTNDEIIDEDKQFAVDILNERSSYPLAKRLAENLCASYAVEYNVPVKVARLAQVIGDNLAEDDNRAIAQFVRNAKNHHDIELATDGKSKQTYISIDDTISALLTILVRGEDGEAYNVADESTYCSIRELAELAARTISDNKSKVTVNHTIDTKKYAPLRTLRIGSGKLRALGWSAQISFEDAIKKLAGMEA